MKRQKRALALCSKADVGRFGAPRHQATLSQIIATGLMLDALRAWLSNGYESEDSRLNGRAKRSG